jgi:hypothetical protein
MVLEAFGQDAPRFSAVRESDSQDERESGAGDSAKREPAHAQTAGAPQPWFGLCGPTLARP